MITGIFKNKTARQTILLFSAQIFSMGIIFVANIILAQQMRPTNYGIYSFTLAVITFVAIFFEFGYFASGARLLAAARDEREESEYIGALLIVAGFVSVSFIICIYLISLFIDYLFRDHIGGILRIASIVSFSFILPLFMELISRGSNRIEILARFHFFWKTFFLIAIGVLYAISELEPLNVLLSFSITLFLSFFIFVARLKPSLKSVRQKLFILRQENKAFGMHSYFGRIIDISTFHLDRLMISYFVNAQNVGFYSLAFSMASPINILSRGLASSKFKSFADEKPIAKRLLLFNFSLILFSACGTLFLGGGIIYYYLGNDYLNIFPLVTILIIAVSFGAGHQVYNAWLNSNGYGKYLKRKSMYTAPVNLILNFIFIPIWGALGAAIATVLSYFLALYLHIYYYRNALLKVS